MNRVRIMAILFALLFVPFLSSAADAYHSRHSRGHAGHHQHRQFSYRDSDGCTFTNDGRRICNTNFQSMPPTNIDAIGNRSFARVDSGTTIGSRPSGCPHSYCGCGLRKYLGISDVRLNLASNWARLLPRESGPRPGLAAVRSSHVMYIEAAAGNGQWLIRDYNSGGGLSRMHVRDVRGYIFVNPHGGMARG